MHEHAADPLTEDRATFESAEGRRNDLSPCPIDAISEDLLDEAQAWSLPHRLVVDLIGVDARDKCRRAEGLADEAGRDASRLAGADNDDCRRPSDQNDREQGEPPCQGSGSRHGFVRHQLSPGLHVMAGPKMATGLEGRTSRSRRDGLAVSWET